MRELAIGVCVTNLQSSVAFYELLGLREAYRNERGVLMAAGDARLFLFATRRADPPPVVPMFPYLRDGASSSVSFAPLTA